MDTMIPALSLRQPWAWAVLHAGKHAENRTWATRYRGRIRLHAARTWDAAGERFIEAAGVPWVPTHHQLRDRGELGAYVGEATVVDCWRLDDMLRDCAPDWEDEQGRWIFGPVVWVLKDVVAYPQPIPGRGYPGLYRPENFPPYGERRNG